MKNSKWIGLFGVLLLLIAGYQPWIWVVSKNLTVSGMNTMGTNFGKPALISFYLSAIAVGCFLMSSVMAKRVNIFVCAFNIAWTLRNFIIISTCRAGECPEKQYGLYLYCAASVIMLVAALSPDVTLKDEIEDYLDPEEPAPADTSL